MRNVYKIHNGLQFNQGMKMYIITWNAIIQGTLFMSGYVNMAVKNEDIMAKVCMCQCAVCVQGRSNFYNE